MDGREMSLSGGYKTITIVSQTREQGNLQKKKPGKSRPKRRKNEYEKQSCLFTTINITENNGEIVKRM